MVSKFTSPKYRPDIDGLRAVAVLSVVGFHAFPEWVQGGFTGVDIFFVISGYLISTIIFENLDGNRFSFVEFYSRRIKRIFPALLCILLFCFSFGWIALLADEYLQLGKHIAGGAGFLSNIILWSESGYFDNEADTKPLLHLWSLGIEEQFYIFWPLLLWWLCKRRLNMLLSISMLATLSFLLCISVGTRDGVAAFYAPWTRFWELLIGAILAYTTFRRRQKADPNAYLLFGWFEQTVSRFNHVNKSVLENTASLAGASLIMLGLLITTQESFFPGWLALLPTLGTALIIAAGPGSWVNRTILNRGVLVWFGLISYPLYLWHWPLLSFNRIIQSGQTTPVMQSAVVAVSILLAWLTLKLIEQPIRFGQAGRLKVVLLVIAMAYTGLLGLSCYYFEGFQSRKVIETNPHRSTGWGGGIAETFLVNECGIKDPAEKSLFANCLSDSRQKPRFALLGDSKAAALYAGLFRTSSKDGRWQFIGGNGPNGAPVPVISEKDIYKNYQQLTDIAVTALVKQDNIEVVLLAAASRELLKMGNDKSIAGLEASKLYPAAYEGLNNTITRLTSKGKKIMLLVDNPTLPDPKDCMDRKTSSEVLNRLLLDNSGKPCQIKIDEHLKYTGKYRQMLNELVAADPQNVIIFDSLGLLCNQDKQLCESYKDGHILYSFTDHISDYAAGMIGREINQFLLQEIDQ